MENKELVMTDDAMMDSFEVRTVNSGREGVAGLIGFGLGIVTTLVVKKTIGYIKRSRSNRIAEYEEAGIDVLSLHDE